VAPSASSSPAAQKPGVYLGEPDFATTMPAIDDTKPSGQQSAPPPKQTPSPAMIEEGSSSPFPVGIASFSQVIADAVSAGLRPNDLEAFNWLESKGYKTIVYLRDGQGDDSSDRKQVENHGMKYVSLTVTPDRIKPELVAEFNQLINDRSKRPIFVYDDKGARSGVMWYLYFRTSEGLSNDEAEVRARRHGLNEKGSEEQIQLMTAVQKYLAERKQ